MARRRRGAASCSPRFSGLDDVAVAHHGRRAQRAYLDALAGLIAAEIAREQGLVPGIRPPPAQDAAGQPPGRKGGAA